MREENFLENPLPNSLEAEKACLGFVLLDNSVMEVLARELTDHDFYSPLNRRVFNAMLVVHRETRPIDPFTVGDILKLEGSLDQIGGVSSITNLTFGLPLHIDITESVAAIRRDSVARDAIRMATSLTRDLLAGDCDIQEVVAKAEQKILHLNTKVSGQNEDDPQGFIEARDITPTVRQQFVRYNEGYSSGVKTGNIWLDDKLDGGGLQGKASYIVAGAEKSGKTSMGLDWAYNIAVEQKLVVPIITLEMSKESLFKRLYSKHTGIPYYMFRPGFHDSAHDPYYTRALEGLDNFGEYQFKIADNLFQWSQIRMYCVRQVEAAQRKGTKVGAIFLDYLQLVNYDLAKWASEFDNITMVSRAIKLLASEIDTPIVAMSNLNRLGMSEGQEPDTFNLYGSQRIAFDAEAVIFVHDPLPKDREKQDVEDRLLILSRQRNGPTGRVKMKFIGPYMTFLEEWQYDKLSAGRDDPLVDAPAQREKIKQDQEAMWDDDDEAWLGDRTR